MTQWIAVDFDRTLATYNGKIDGPLGDPIKPMLERVKAWLSDGLEVRVFTARADSPLQRKRIAKWLDDNGIGGLAITNQKDSNMAELWDDLAIRVVPNSGKVCAECAKCARFNQHEPNSHSFAARTETNC